MKKNVSKIIVALDMDLTQAKDLVKELGSSITIYKVGLELFLQSGKEILAFLHQKQKLVFLDLKFYDIPNTIKEATLNIISYPNIVFYTLHALGGRNMIEASVHASKNSNALPIAVTALTSFADEEWRGILSLPSVEESVLHLATYASNAGVHGVVCSAREANAIKMAVNKPCITICPGIRPSGAAKQDQSRTLTPKEAIDNGADYLVIGRPITEAFSPKKATEAIIQEIAEQPHTAIL